MSANWPSASYGLWAETCDTLHAHTQPLPAPDGSGSLVVLLDLRTHEAVVEHSAGPARRVPLTPDRPVAEVTRDVLAAVAQLAGAVKISLVPQEVPWRVPLDEDYQHAAYDAGRAAEYFAAATQAALVLAAFRAPYRGRSTPVNAWWGSFDLAVGLFSGLPTEPPSDDFIMRNAGDAQLIEVGWWPGDPRYEKAAFYAYAHPAPPAFGRASLSPAGARWDEALGEYILDWDEVRADADPRAAALEFARSAFRHACLVCGWDAELAATVEGRPPPIT
jgi:hypothetical protein